MAVISITITESQVQIVSGIPRTVDITTNIPAAIFYTLDGSTPTLFSAVYTSPIVMPTDKLSVTLKIVATNGTDTSPVVTDTYITNLASDTGARLSHSSTTAEAESNIPDLYPFGDSSNQPNASFESPSDAGITVNNPALAATPTGFDGAGHPTGFTNKPFDVTNYSIKYSSTDSEGQTGRGIGNLPAKVSVVQPTPPPEWSDQNSNTFDPRAFVIFQDASKENPNDPPHINRMHFSLENPETARDGNHFFTAGLDAPPVSGTFLRQHFNPRTNMMTYYYLDTWTNKWIISTAPFNPNNNPTNSIAGMVLSNQPGSRFVFRWVPFARRVLF